MVVRNNLVHKVTILGIVLLFMLTSYSSAFLQNPYSKSLRNDQGRGITWDVTVNFDEPGGAHDNTVFGEATDAHDGPPADAYDVVKPPAPMPSYIRVCLNDNLPYPYDMLWKDYRHYPGIYKIWNLSVQWVPSDFVTPTTITITWSTAAINSTEYSSIILCTSGGTPLKNMLLSSSYSFNCPAYIPQDFKIICLVNEPPYVPSSPNPANGSTGISINTDLSWAGGDPDPGDTVTYDVYFGTSSSPPKLVGNQSGLTYNPGTLLYSTLYYWKIIAWDNHGFSRASLLWHFTTTVQPNNPPNTPNTPSPANGAIDVSVTVDVSWSGGDPDSGDTVLYDVFFGTSSSPQKVVGNQSGQTYNPGTLNELTTYYWKIVAWDNHGATAVGPIWHFTTLELNQPPNIPSNPFPSNGSTGVSVNADLSWTCSDPDGDPLTYDVYFGTSSSPPKVASNISVSTYDPGTLTFYTYFYWKIVAWDNHGASRTGPKWKFMTINSPNQPPYTPSNPSPANGSIEVSINVDLCWTGGDPDSGDFVTYDVYLGTTFPLTKIASNKTSTTIALDPLLYSTKYYWKIISWDNHQAFTAGPVWSFNTKIDTTLPTVKITSPIKGYLYVNFGDVFVRKIPILITTFIVGRIEVTATATDSQSGIDRVEFYIDDELKTTDTTAPYSWMWLERGYLFQHSIRVTAYDCTGLSSSIGMMVWKIF
jgi:hypothetical protein